MPPNTEKNKRLKDPIYGYISIDDDRMCNIIDTPAFQRLRHITQTSYTPLYSAALHNRFIHSIGVYHIGNIAFKSLKKYVCSDKMLSECLTVEIESDFLNACLLHDIGHSPFSHSGENFYFEAAGGISDPLLMKLKESVSSGQFNNDLNSIEKLKASAHEIMSALVGITIFGSMINDKEFFVRCITGYMYTNDNDIKLQLKNVLIQLLNSSFIDVDKVDYLLRDAFVTGYDTISIDYERLFNGIEVKKCDDKYSLVFNKSTLSIVENVIYAHDSERKWIQNHPVVLYEAFIIQYSIKTVKDYYSKLGLKLFSQEALSENGIENTLVSNLYSTLATCKPDSVPNKEDFINKVLLPNNITNTRVSLLCDDDIIFVMKNKVSDKLISEYFNRKERRHAIWKSEAEFKILFDNLQGNDSLEYFNKMLNPLEKFLIEDCEKPILDLKAIEICEKKLEEISGEENSSDVTQVKKRYIDINTTLNKFKTFASKLSIPFDFVIIEAKRFASNFSKKALGDILLDFPDLPRPRKLCEIETVLKSDKPQLEQFYYIYYRRGNDASLRLTLVAETLRDVFPKPID